MISVIIPARNEPYLQHTVDDVFEKAAGSIEIIVVLDGYWPDPPLKPDTRLRIAHHGQSKGMRAAINTGARMAKGTYLLKCDAHCCFDKGFDQKLKADLKKPDWVVVPRRYVLDVKTWDRSDRLGNDRLKKDDRPESLPHREKYYEFEHIERGTLKGRKWPEFADRVKDQQVCDLMTFQGSCWFMHRGWFVMMGLLDEVNFASMGREAQEISLYAWLNGGRCVLTRNTWYAHWNKTRAHVIRNPEKKRSIAAICEKYPEKKLWPLIERFDPVPGWPGKEVRGQRSEVGGQRSEVRGQRSEVGGQRAEDQAAKGAAGKNEKPETDMTEIKTGMNRAGLYEHFAALGFKVGAEIGVQRGRNAIAMMNIIPGLKLYLVDPYKDYDLSNRRYGEKTHAKFRNMTHKRMEGLDVVFIEKFSEDAARDVPDNSLDFVYIDGMHWYDFVMLDIILWSRKVREGGIISGHDYVNNRRLIGVMRAVDNYVESHGIKPLYITDVSASKVAGDKCASWFFVKPSSGTLKGETVNCTNR